MSEEQEAGLPTAQHIDLSAILDELKKLDVPALRDLARKEQLVELIAKMRMGIITHQEHVVLARVLDQIGAVMPENYNRVIDGVAKEIDGEEPKALPAPAEKPPRMELPTFEDEEEYE